MKRFDSIFKVLNWNPGPPCVRTIFVSLPSLYWSVVLIIVMFCVFIEYWKCCKIVFITIYLYRCFFIHSNYIPYSGNKPDLWKFRNLKNNSDPAPIFCSKHDGRNLFVHPKFLHLEALARPRLRCKESPLKLQPPRISCFLVYLYLVCQDNVFASIQIGNCDQKCFIFNHRYFISLNSDHVCW